MLASEDSAERLIEVNKHYGREICIVPQRVCAHAVRFFGSHKTETSPHEQSRLNMSNIGSSVRVRSWAMV